MALDLHHQRAHGATPRPARSGAPALRSVRPGAPGPGAGRARDPRRAPILGARIVITAILVLGQLWALTVATVALEAGPGGMRSRVWLFVAFEALSFVVALGFWTSARREHG
jgi:hypothetical protein